jgi:hypothetical protein
MNSASAGEQWIITLTVVTSRCSSYDSGCFTEWQATVFDADSASPDLATIICNSSRSPDLCLVIWDHLDCLLMQLASTHILRSVLVSGRLSARNVFHLLAEVTNHESTIVESVHNKILAIFKFPKSLLLLIYVVVIANEETFPRNSFRSR